MYLMVEPPLVGPFHRVDHERLVTTPTRFCELRRDLYGNLQRQLVAAQGTFTFEFTATIEAAANVPSDSRGNRAASATITARGDDLHPSVAILPVGPAGPDGAARIRAHASRREPRAGHQPVGPAACRLRLRHDRLANVGLRHGHRASRRLPRLRAPGHRVLPGTRHPARYASGYALGLEPPDFHGFAQVYLGGAWHNVDATSETVRPALVPIAVGRDAADVAMTTIWGTSTVVEQTVEVKEIEA